MGRGRSVEKLRSIEKAHSRTEARFRDKAACKEFEKLIPAYLGQKLDYPAMKRFYGHWEECGECREELSIQFLVTEGIQRLEEGSAFDLQSELGQRLEETRRRIGFHRACLYFGAVMEIAVSCLLVCIYLWILLI